MSSVANTLLEEMRPELLALIKEAVKDALREGGAPGYPERVNVDQAMEITGYSRNSIYQMRSAGTIPGAVKIGGKLMFETAVLQDWVRNGAPRIAS